MLHQSSLMSLLAAASTLQSIAKTRNNILHVALFNTPSFFSLESNAGCVMFVPLAFRIIYSSRIKCIQDLDNPVQGASIICCTRNSVAKLVGQPVKIEGLGFDVFGRLRKSKCHNSYHEFTSSSYVSISVSSIVSQPSGADVWFEKAAESARNFKRI
jgi:hypothetical protein